MRQTLYRYKETLYLDSQQGRLVSIQKIILWGKYELIGQIIFSVTLQAIERKLDNLVALKFHDYESK